MGIEDVGIVRAVHHLVAVVGILVAAAAVGPVGLGAMAVSRHPVTRVTHGNVLLIVVMRKNNNNVGRMISNARVDLGCLS